MPPSEGREIVKIVIDAREGVTEEIRNGIGAIMGALAFSMPDGSIDVPSRHIEAVTTFVKERIPDVGVIDEDGRTTFRKKEDPKPVVTAPVITQADDWTSADEIESTYRYGDHQQWGEFWKQVNNARSLAAKANKPSKGQRWPTNRITVTNGSFYYRGESLSITGDNDKLRTVKELKRWRAEVNRAKNLR